jgi:hypothetical protein
MRIINKEDIKDIIKSFGGRLFSVTFVKADRTVRVLTGRMHVTKFLAHSDKPKRKHTKDNLVTVFDIHKKEYRSVNVDTVSHIKGNRETFIVK